MTAAGDGIGAGSRIASYRLQEQIGRGGMAAVFLARDERLNRLVALKVLAPALAADEAFRRRFLRESRAAAAVDDPHIIPVHEAGDADGVLFIAMRYVPGGDLGALMRRMGPLSLERATAITSAVASALDAAHSVGLVHRDVKPTNMLLDTRPGRPDHVYLSDFGLAKGLLSSAKLTSTGQFLGTADYSAPEQIEGKPLDGRADQYSLACAAFEMLSGGPPFQRDHATAVIWAHMAEPPPLVTSLRPGLPLAVDQVIAKGLAKARGDRYASCSEFADALRAALGLRPYDSDPHAVAQADPTESEIAKPAEPSTESMGIHATTDAARAADGPGIQPEQDTVHSDRPHGGLVPAVVTAELAGVSSTPGHRWRATLAAAAAAVVLAAGGVGVILYARGHGALVPRHRNGSHAVQPLAAPRCWQMRGSAPTVNSHATWARLPAGPYGLQASPDGRYSFAAIADSIVVMRNKRGVPSLPPIQTIQVPGHAKDELITSNGRYLLVADGNGAAVIDVKAAENRGLGTPLLGQLASPISVDKGGAAQVALSTGNHFAFVTLETQNDIAVFNLARAVSLGFNQADFIRFVPIKDPVGIAASPDGRWLYVTSKTTGLVSVIDMYAAETASTNPVVSATAAGCSPIRVITSPDGGLVWVTARDSNALLGFSAARLRTHPANALIADVQVGESPVGEVLIKSGGEIVIADSNTSGKATGTVAIVDTSRAVAGKPSLLGIIKSSLMPREVAIELSATGYYLLITFDNSANVQVFKIAELP